MYTFKYIFFALLLFIKMLRNKAACNLDRRENIL